ncbi:hypothetical protein KY316_03170 [Candidatus Woesearchaeota archaeon]|nr:hypothetical protein [Candidatus Woesearchaeota archaeon]
MDEPEYENPFYDYIADLIPTQTIRARSFDDYVAELFEGCGKFHYNERIHEKGILYIEMQDIYQVHEAYWKQFLKDLVGFPQFGQDVLNYFEDDEKITLNEAYEKFRKDYVGHSPRLVKDVLERLVECGALGKTDYESKSSEYFKTSQCIDLGIDIDWKKCWQHGLDFMKEHNPELVGAWVKRQVKDGYVTVLDPFKGEYVQLFKVDENGLPEDQ